MRGVFISLEGGEGTGKSTQLAVLARRLEALRRRTVTTRQPGGTPLGEKVRELLVRRTDDPPTPWAELFLYAADRAHHVATVIRPALERGEVVLCDRYADATLAYQGWGRQLPLDRVELLNTLAADELWPDRTVLLDLPPREGIRRSLAREARNVGPREERFEAEVEAFHERVRRGYLEIARTHPERVKLVDGSGSIEAVAARIWAEVNDLFAPPPEGGER